MSTEELFSAGVDAGSSAVKVAVTPAAARRPKWEWLR